MPMNKDLEQAITNKLRNISSRFNNHHTQYYKLLDELCQTIVDMKKCEKEMLDAFKQELVGRSLSDGLSAKQLLLADALDALAVGMEELQTAYKKMEGVSQSLDGLEETEKAISCLIEVLGMEVEERRP